MSGWQPIETAPKDGTRILIFQGGLEWSREVQIGWWDSGGTRSGWSASSYEDGHILNEKQAPTHWMPLPSPPESL